MKIFLEKSEGMASRDTFLQRHSNKVELLSFVPKKEQKDFSQYLYSNYQVWNKERRRCFYRCRKFKKNSIPIINNAPSFTLNSVLSINILPATVSFIATTTERIKTKPNLELNSKSNSIIKSKMISSAFSSGSASFHTSYLKREPKQNLVIFLSCYFSYFSFYSSFKLFSISVFHNWCSI